MNLEILISDCFMFIVVLSLGAVWYLYHAIITEGHYQYGWQAQRAQGKLLCLLVLSLCLASCCSMAEFDSLQILNGAIMAFAAGLGIIGSESWSQANDHEFEWRQENYRQERRQAARLPLPE
ncbi:MAG: hypothetical protein WCT37_05000 [Patescibacteria group bacterium]|jgi:hypothetical protein